MTAIKVILYFISTFFLFAGIYCTSIKMYYLYLVRIKKVKKNSVNFFAEIIFFTIFATLQYVIFIM